eukprot:COSAG04_NODE_2211_length_4523_cov_5.122061_6_plen_54_part_00
MLQCQLRVSCVSNTLLQHKARNWKRGQENGKTYQDTDVAVVPARATATAIIES